MGEGVPTKTFGLIYPSSQVGGASLSMAQRQLVGILKGFKKLLGPSTPRGTRSVAYLVVRGCAKITQALDFDCFCAAMGSSLCE
jgi:hypothetical protein